jgi:hypothetical protein
MDNIKIKIGEREIPLRFRMPEFLEIEENVGNLGEIRQLILKGKQRLRNMITVTRILGNAGLKAAGETADLTDEWLTENMEPHKLLQYQLAVIACLSEESKSEAAEEESESHERDLVLEEIQEKKDPVNSHTGE